MIRDADAPWIFTLAARTFKKETAGWVGARKSKHDYVGFRDIEANPPHITLATNPPTRFVFPRPGPSVKVPGRKVASLEPRDFYDFQMRLFYEAGVKTLDMT